jgi:hypothetical protein
MRKSAIIVLFVIALCSSVFGLKVGSHRVINEHIAVSNTVGFSLDDYLKNNLGIINGVQEYFKKGNENRRVFDWQSWQVIAIK